MDLVGWISMIYRAARFICTCLLLVRDCFEMTQALIVPCSEPPSVTTIISRSCLNSSNFCAFSRRANILFYCIPTQCPSSSTAAGFTVVSAGLDKARICHT